MEGKQRFITSKEKYTTTIYLSIWDADKVLSLKCYTCSSAKSWDDCKSEEKDCETTDKADRCVKAHVKYGDTEAFAKYCGKKENCNSCERAKDKVASECSVNCCESDLCNAGSAVKISGIVMVACTLALLLFQNA